MGRGGLWRRVVAVSVLGVLGLSGVVAWSQSSAPQPVDALEPEMNASREAKVSGQPVVVQERTTETTQVVANVDGSFTLTSDHRPVRAKVNGDWWPVDLTLGVRPDGRVGPAVSPVEVSLSNGGGGTFAEMVVDDRTLRLRWPGQLPVPTLNGPRAVYANVYEGVDLVVYAESEGFREVLVVRTPAALDQLRAAKVRFGFEADGVRLSAGRPGKAAVRGPSGDLLQELESYWWDSSYDPQVGAPPSAEGPGGAEARPLAVAVQPGGAGGVQRNQTLELAVDQTVGGGQVQFPLFIDPALVKPRNHWLTVRSSGTSWYDVTGEELRVGYCNFTGCGGAWNARSYFSFVTTDITSPSPKPTANVVYAKVYATQMHSASCTSLPVDLYSANAFTSTTAWPGPIVAKLDAKSSAAGLTCPTPSAVLDFDAGAVTTYLQTAANNDSQVTSFVLRAPVEGNGSYWKKFAPEELRLEVKYNFPPPKATNLRIEGQMSCGPTPFAPDSTPRLLANVTDNNVEPAPLRLVFTLMSATSTTALVNGVGQVDFVPHGGVGGWDVPANVETSGLVPGTTYRFKVKVFNLTGDNTSLGSADPDPIFTFAIPPAVSGATRPTVGPAITYAAASKTFTFATTDSAQGVTGYSYAWFGPPRAVASGAVCPAAVPDDGSGGVVLASSGTASAAVPAGLTGRVTVNVRSFNSAGNLSPVSSSTVVVP